MDHTESLDTRRVMLHCELPLNEILVDFNDKIKSITRGYGSMDYEHAGYRAAKLVKLDLLVNGEPVDAFSSIVHRDRAEARGRQLAAKLKEVIPRQLYQVAIQAAIGGKIIARESVSRLAQKRDREMLRRRYHPQTQAAREAERRKKADEEHREDQHPAGSVYRGAEGAMNREVAPSNVMSSGRFIERSRIAPAMAFSLQAFAVTSQLTLQLVPASFRLMFQPRYIKHSHCSFAMREKLIRYRQRSS